MADGVRRRTRAGAHRRVAIESLRSRLDTQRWSIRCTRFKASLLRKLNLIDIRVSGCRGVQIAICYPEPAQALHDCVRVGVLGTRVSMMTSELLTPGPIPSSSGAPQDSAKKPAPSETMPFESQYYYVINY
jgi:hypothetical protein